MKEEQEDVLFEQVRELRRGESDDPENTARILGEKRKLGPPVDERTARREMFARSRRSFLLGGAAALAGVFGWRWMPEETKSNLLRRTFEFNERVSQLFYRPSRLAPEFPPDRISPRRVNGLAGMESALDSAAWTLRVGGL